MDTQEKPVGDDLYCRGSGKGLDTLGNKVIDACVGQNFEIEIEIKSRFEQAPLVMVSNGGVFTCIGSTETNLVPQQEGEKRHDER